MAATKGKRASGFNLDRAISSWRFRLRLRRFFLAEDIDELEAHLRDHTEELVGQGIDERLAFARALDRLGSGRELEPAFRKVRFTRRKQRHSISRSFFWNLTMFRNYYTTAIRNFRRHKGFAAINLGGLAIGLSACLLIGLFVQDELAFDGFHEKGDRIYRLGQSTVGWPYGRILESEYPEVEDVVYMRSYPAHSIRHEGTYYYEPMLYADQGFFEMFSFPLIDGNPATALQLPYSLVLSDRFANTLFGSTDAVGQTLVLSDSLRFTVTGVAHVPSQSHIQFSALVSLETLGAMDPEWIAYEMDRGWLDLNAVNYVLLRPGVDAATFREKIRDLPTERAGEYLSGWGSSYWLDLEPMPDIYLRSAYGNHLGPRGSIDRVWLLSTIGLFLLLIAIVNFINLTTARSVDRAREVGVRKVAGSSRAALMRQFLGESLITSFIAVVLAYGIALLAVPFFNDLAARSYSAADLFTLQTVLAVVGLGFVVGLLAGIYPAFVLSSFRPIAVLAGRTSAGRRGTRLRQGLVVFQFGISGALVIGTLVVLSQLRFMQEQDLGFDADRVLVLDARRVPSDAIARQGGLLKQTLADIPSVTRVSETFYVPGRGGWRGQISFPEGMPEGEAVSLEYVPVDEDFAETMGLTVVAGRDFDEAYPTDASSGVVINEAAVDAAGWSSASEAVGKMFTSPGSGKPDGVVLGVVENYHHHGLNEAIEPMMFGVRRGGGLFAMRLRGADAADVVARIQSTWPRVFGSYPYEYFFLDQDFAAQYEAEQRLGRIFTTFALLTILIASLGLFGLAAFTAAQRRKEIGVRKAMGASIPEIVRLLSRGFLQTVLVAFVISIPVAYWAMSRWLEQFPYRTGIGVDLILIGGVLLLLVSLLTVSYQAVRAAVADPVRSLRYE